MRKQFSLWVVYMIEHDLIFQKFVQISFFLTACWVKPARVSSWASFKKRWSRRTTRYQAVTLSTHCTLYRQQICAIFFLFSALEAEIIMSLGHSWPFFFLLKRLYTITIKAWMHDVLLTYNNSGSDCWLSSHAHCYFSLLCLILMFLIYIFCYLLH